jgi:hypothetical protein
LKKNCFVCAVLTSLGLPSNGIGDDGARELADALKDNGSLTCFTGTKVLASWYKSTDSHT